jgi:nitroreductase|tara:strand:+ start:26 stop:283 length:258 start_codon:yes stop_codon:yes gene_type:complete
MNVYEAVIKRRTIRRFKQQSVSFEILEKIVNSGRLAPSGANLQPVEFLVVDILEHVVKVFEILMWAESFLRLVTLRKDRGLLLML